MDFHEGRSMCDGIYFFPGTVVCETGNLPKSGKGIDRWNFFPSHGAAAYRGRILSVDHLRKKQSAGWPALKNGDQCTVYHGAG